MKQPSEKVIENQILHCLTLKGVFCWKVKTVGTFDQKIGRFRSPSKLYMKGVADILGVLPGGRFLAIEVKSAKGKTSPHQDLYLHRVREEGGIAFVARSWEEVDAKLRGLLKTA